MADGVPAVPQKTCQLGTGNEQFRDVFILISSACEQGSVEISTTRFFLSFFRREQSGGVDKSNMGVFLLL
jgi:hypothetical protein